MRNDLASLSRSAHQNLVTEQEKNLVIVAARLSGVQLKEVARRTGRNANYIAHMVKKLANDAEKFRQAMRADSELMKLCGFDSLFPPKVGDARVDKVMMAAASPIYPGSRKKKRTTATVRRIADHPLTQSIPHSLEKMTTVRSLPLPTRANSAALEQAVTACAKYVLDRLRG